MFIVLISARFKSILEWLMNSQYQDIEEIKVVKRRGPRQFLYVKTNLSYGDIISEFKKVIKDNGGINYVYEFYSLFDGMIDYSPYLRDELKREKKYYQNPVKDLSENEIKDFLKG